jgi:hypothetical protein
MEALLAEFFKSLLPEAVKTMGGEAIAGEALASAAPQAMAPMTMGQAAGNIATQSIGQQIQPAMTLYNQVTAPGATPGDMASSAFQYSIQSEKDPQNRVAIPAMGPMNPYANMANNTVGGIPSLLQNTQSGLLPYIGAR